MLSRGLALLIGTLALASLRGQFDVLPEAPLADKLWLMAGYFTVLTNLGVAGAMFAVARGWKMGGGVAAGLVVAVLLEALVYQLVLADLWHHQGNSWWADQGSHTAVPLLVCVWWAFFSPKDIGLRDLPKWLIWPLVYCGYVMARGFTSHVWPYPFMEVDYFGPWVLVLSIAGLVVLSVTLGAALVGVARLLR